MNIQEKMKAVLLETAEYYKADPTRVAKDHKGLCSYLDESGRMCAVGRCLIDPGRLNNKLGAGIESLIADESLTQEDFKSEYRGLPTIFWVYLQALHDCADWEDPTQIDRRVSNFLSNINSGLYGK